MFLVLSGGREGILHAAVGLLQEPRFVPAGAPPKTNDGVQVAPFFDGHIFKMYVEDAYVYRC